MVNQRKYQAYNLSNYGKIPQISKLNAEDREAIEVVGRVLPFKSNNYVTEELIDWNNIPDDPIFTLNFPRREMLLKKQYNEVLHLIKSGANEDALKNTINKIRLDLNPNPADQKSNVPILGDKNAFYLFVTHRHYHFGAHERRKFLQPRKIAAACYLTFVKWARCLAHVAAIQATPQFCGGFH